MRLLGSGQHCGPGERRSASMAESSRSQAKEDGLESGDGQMQGASRGMRGSMSWTTAGLSMYKEEMEGGE